MESRRRRERHRDPAAVETHRRGSQGQHARHRRHMPREEKKRTHRTTRRTEQQQQQTKKPQQLRSMGMLSLLCADAESTSACNEPRGWIRRRPRPDRDPHPTSPSESLPRDSGGAGGDELHRSQHSRRQQPQEQPTPSERRTGAWIWMKHRQQARAPPMNRSSPNHRHCCSRHRARKTMQQP